jgi:hypothetical protein
MNEKNYLEFLNDEIPNPTPIENVSSISINDDVFSSNQNYPFTEEEKIINPKFQTVNVENFSIQNDEILQVVKLLLEKLNVPKNLNQQQLNLVQKEEELEKKKQTPQKRPQIQNLIHPQQQLNQQQLNQQQLNQQNLNQQQLNLVQKEEELEKKNFLEQFIEKKQTQQINLNSINFEFFNNNNFDEKKLETISKEIIQKFKDNNIYKISTKTLLDICNKFQFLSKKNKNFLLLKLKNKRKYNITFLKKKYGYKKKLLNSNDSTIDSEFQYFINSISSIQKEGNGGDMNNETILKNCVNLFIFLKKISIDEQKKKKIFETLNNVIKEKVIFQNIFKRIFEINTKKTIKKNNLINYFILQKFIKEDENDENVDISLYSLFDNEQICNENDLFDFENFQDEIEKIIYFNFIEKIIEKKFILNFKIIKNNKNRLIYKEEVIYKTKKIIKLFYSFFIFLMFAKLQTNLGGMYTNFISCIFAINDNQLNSQYQLNFFEILKKKIENTKKIGKLSIIRQKIKYYFNLSNDIEEKTIKKLDFNLKKKLQKV